MMSTRRPATLNFTAPLVLESPRHSGLSSIALKPGRHLIGTTADCGIRLQADGVLERHAIILVGENRTVVKSLDPRTWVNDGPVTEMALRAGDRLSIGPVTFRVRSATREEAAEFLENDPAAAQESPVITRPSVPTTIVAARANAAKSSLVQSQEQSLIETRLEELEQRLSELRLAPKSITPTADEHCIDVHRVDASAMLEIQRRQDELQRQARQIADDTQRLQQREELVAEREAQVERRQQSLFTEAERIAEIAETTRTTLATEHAEHVALWNEWETTYQRAASDLAAQIQAVEQQRVALQKEADRLAAARSELQASRTAHEAERQRIAADRLKLSNELADAALMRTQQESLHRQRQLQLEDWELQLATRQREFEQQNVELSTGRQQLELERAQIDLSAERQAQFTAEEQRLSHLRTQLELDQQQVQSERAELALLKATLEQQQAAFEQAQADAAQPQCESPAPAQTANYRTSAPDAFPQPRIVPPPIPGFEAQFPAESRSGESERVVISDQTPPLPPPLPVSSEQPNDFGVVVDWSALSAVDSQFESGRAGKVDHNLTSQSGEIESRGFDLLEAPGAPEPFPLPQFTGVESSPWPAPNHSTGGSYGLNDPADPWGNSQPPHPCPATSNSSSLAEASPNLSDPWATFAAAGLTMPTSLNADSGPGFGTIPSVENDYGPPAAEREADLLAKVSADFGSPVWPELSRDVNAPGYALDRERDAADGVKATLAEVNREFGVPIENPPGEPAPGGLPAWWMDGTQSAASTDHAGDSGQPSWVDALRSESVEPVSEQSLTDRQPAGDLRSQLAMLFDLPPTQSESSATDVDRAVAERAAESSIDPVASIEDSKSVPPVADESHTETSHSEDSVDDFMARLLARSRERSDAEESLKPQQSSRNAKVGAVSVASDDGALFSLPDSDRSHLMAEPKHKQDKQAVRENLQSFRQVAHLSARSALARHSLTQLRNATIAKGVLLSVSTAAAVWFFIEPLRGLPLQTWKGVACSLGALLSAMEFRRSWKQLKKPLAGNSTPAPKPTADRAPAAEAESTETRQAAVTDTTTDAPEVSSVEE
ncbi:MAG: hypothetical protein JSS49_13585 [Planctomycetes bacterium]|nr:hypothetical protein [Planctomycetota bacterium]